jgi:hypothetical protein
MTSYHAFRIISPFPFGCRQAAPSIKNAIQMTVASPHPQFMYELSGSTKSRQSIPVGLGSTAACSRAKGRNLWQLYKWSCWQLKNW